MNKILITGASGFIGRHVLPLLSRDAWEIHALSRQSRSSIGSNTVWHPVDLLTKNAVLKLADEIQPSHLLHLAWYHEGQSYWRSPENSKWLEASDFLVKSVIDLKVSRIVIAGTCAENLRPISPYGSAKAELFERVQKRCLDVETTLAWGQVFFPYGPYQDETRLIPSILHSLSQGNNAKCLFPTLIRDYIYVEDVARAFRELLSSSVEGKFEIGTGTGLTLGEIATTAAEISGYAKRVEFGSQRSNDPPVITANPIRLKNELGFEPKTDLRTGIRRMIEAK